MKEETEILRRLSFYSSIGNVIFILHGLVLIYILFIGWNSMLYLPYEILYFGYSILYFLIFGSMIRNWERISCKSETASESSVCSMCKDVNLFLLLSFVYFLFFPTSFQYNGYIKSIRMGQLILALISLASFKFFKLRSR